MSDVSASAVLAVDLARRPEAPPWFAVLALEQRGFNVPAETPVGRQRSEAVDGGD